MGAVAHRGKMNRDSLEGSIQNLLSALYPPFEATAPTLLSQLFQIIDSRYRGDALRCLLDFLVPAKHILEAVQQAACAQYSDVLFLCEGWPLCLRDQVVIHLAPISPLLLRPGDFYLQVAPFCEQSARIVVCSLLAEEGLRVEVVEETPIPETSYPCIFSCEWLAEVNQGRHGSPLSRCLLASEQGVVRLPWERVALPSFVDVPQCAGSSMASVPPSHPHSPPPPRPLCPSPTRSFCLAPSLDSAAKLCPKTIESSILTSSSHSSTFSVETRICPAKHGIAVSLRLVDTSATSASGLVKAKETEAEHKPIGWVTPNMWDSRFTGTDASSKTAKTNTASSKCTAANANTKGLERSVQVPENAGPEPGDSSVSRSGRTGDAAADAEYIDVFQASLLFGTAHSGTGEEQISNEHKQMQRYPPRQAQMHPRAVELHGRAHMQPNAEIPPRAQVPVSDETAPHCSQLHHNHNDSCETSPCVRTVRFAEKPCTPCTRRRQVQDITKEQDMRCRYRDSYQAAIKNPVSFGQEQKGHMLALAEEDGDSFLCDGGQRPPGGETGDPRRDPPVSAAPCKESEEKRTAPCWKAGGVNGTSTEHGKNCGPEEQPGSEHYLHSATGSQTEAGAQMNTSTALSSSDGAKRSDAKPGPSGMKPQTGLPRRTSSTAPQSRREPASERRCSSLSTAVVETSERCELVLVEGQKVRRRGNTGVAAEIPQLHVVKCKNSTAFGLVSPKISRRRVVVPDVPQPSLASITSGCRMEDPSQPDQPAAAETQKILQAAPARPRPDHLPLGSPDPGAHPLVVGVAALTGGRDRAGRPVLELYGDHQGWRAEATSWDLFQMLLYFYSITRKEIRKGGMTLVFDARKTLPQPQLYKALMSAQEQTPHTISSLVLLVDKESVLRPEKCPGIQSDVVTSMKALFKLVEVSQLSARLGGTLSHRRCDWMELHQRLFPFVCNLHEASNLLLRAIRNLEEPRRTDTVQTVQQCMTEQRTLMRDVLEDHRLVRLQRDGGSILARLRKESDLKYPHCEHLSDAVDSVTSLYNSVEQQAHVLVQRSNMSLEQLEYLLQVREMEEHFTQMQQWFKVEGDRHLLEAESVNDSGDRMEQILNSFTAFLIEANDRRQHAMSLVSEAERLQGRGASYPETEAFRDLVCTFKSSLEDFLCRAEACGRELQIMVNVCDFCEQATALACECTDYLNQSPSRIHAMQDEHTCTNQPAQEQVQDPGPNSPSLCTSDISAAHGFVPAPTSLPSPGHDSSVLKTFQSRFLQFSPERFQEVKAQASTLQGSRGMRVWNAAWLTCQEARQQLQERLQDAEAFYHQRPDSGGCECHYVDVMSTNVQTSSPGGQSLVVQSTPGPRHPQWDGIVSGAVELDKRRPILGSDCSVIIQPQLHVGNTQESKVIPPSPHRTKKRQVNRARGERDAAALSRAHTVGCQWFPWGRGLGARSASQESCATGAATGSPAPPEPPQPPQARPPSACSHHGPPSCRILQEAQRFQISRHGSFCSEDSCASERAAAGGDGAPCCRHSSLPVGRYEGAFSRSSPQESASNALRLQRVLEELVFTEREYVRSLCYILTHYLPLLDRPDVPQDLRGKRGVIFGNLEKLYDFHSHYFLPELEACQRDAAMVARCFLRHSESFGLYALYSKNKPQSDALILHRRHDIFKRKQQELGDMMDLSSYLLRPIQRISKYSLLLQDMSALSASNGPDRTSADRERAEIQAATDMVRFQMRHGNDLLTMDAIQDCDVNLKEQGQLIRQDEFSVFFRKKKCVRRVFLFADLILFSKTKKTDVGNDVYVYKQSFKTSDIGMTHNSGLSPLCFEIWFRRRKREDTYTLKASSMDVKKAWTSDLEGLLWDQAAHSRELRIQERVFMGMCRQPFMDIQPSDAAICDRAVGCVLPGRRA
ncbi:uncharacterized protein LOC114859073 isoform X2 [Betta splendens]|uniref:Uncharacterized protein LOC114859073 isoform X2 n=1 Tax=Betta splendens TaxID=158456 RepID=A0A9W2XW51_BETSP|nr:uncharacterized protein LOC114859073 isoform X2 [Betta splendens]